MRPNFAIKVTFKDKALPGANIRIVMIVGEETTEVFSRQTGSDGSVNAANLSPGSYWIEAQFLGVIAGYQCFHITERPTRKAKTTIKYHWGDLAPSTRTVAGKFIDLQRGNGGTPLWNLTHPVKVPVESAKMELRDPTNGIVYQTTSQGDGTFNFEGVHGGTYVLHIQGGNAGEKVFDSADFLLEVSPKGKGDSLLLTRSDGTGSGCGGTSLEVVAN